jgi:hypothetical protein
VQGSSFSGSLLCVSVIIGCGVDSVRVLTLTSFCSIDYVLSLILVVDL